MGNSGGKQVEEDLALRDDSGQLLQPVVLAANSPGASGPIFPNEEEWAQIKTRLKHTERLVSHLTQRDAAESPSLLLRRIIMSCSSHWKPRHFHALKIFIDLEMGADEQAKFMEIMTRTAKLALRLPKLFPEPLKFLKQGSVGEVALSREQASCLLACMMFGCIQPLQGELVGVFSIAGIYTGPSTPWMLAKLRLLVAYFDAITQKTSKPLLKDIVIYKRCKLLDEVDWKESTMPIANARLQASRDGAIEDEKNAVHADFANASIGGGVMSNGRLQEEIRFCGTLQYSTYKGYADSLEFVAPRRDLDDQSDTGGDTVLAIDAKFFTSFKAQFKESFLFRELNKLNSGLSSLETKADKLAFASGNWGCGAFGGIPQVKALIQLAVCAQSGIDLIYFCHNDRRIDPAQFLKLYKTLKKSKTTVGELVLMIINYMNVIESVPEASRPDLFSHVCRRLPKKDSDENSPLGYWKDMIGS